MIRILRSCTLAATALFVMVQPSAAWIGDVTQDTCTAINCNAQSITGTVAGFSGFAYTWSEQFGIAAGDCVRFDVVSEDTDLKLTIIAPNGNVYQNDDRTPGSDTRPLVKIASAPNFGTYTVQLAHYHGDPMTANFNLLWKRYNAGNPNCASPTVPFAPLRRK